MVCLKVATLSPDNRTIKLFVKAYCSSRVLLNPKWFLMHFQKLSKNSRRIHHEGYIGLFHHLLFELIWINIMLNSRSVRCIRCVYLCCNLKHQIMSNCTRWYAHTIYYSEEQASMVISIQLLNITEVILCNWCFRVVSFWISFCWWNYLTGEKESVFTAFIEKGFNTSQLMVFKPMHQHHTPNTYISTKCVCYLSYHFIIVKEVIRIKVCWQAFIRH